MEVQLKFDLLCSEGTNGLHDEVDRFKQIYFDSFRAANSILNKTPFPETITNSKTNLLILNLPTFNVTLSEWTNFIGTFIALVN